MDPESIFVILFIGCSAAGTLAAVLQGFFSSPERAFRRATAVNFSSVSEGQRAKVKGRICALDNQRLLSPFRQEPCLGYQTRVSRTAGVSDYILADKDEAQLTIDDAQFLPFGLRDDSGLAIVRTADLVAFQPADFICDAADGVALPGVKRFMDQPEIKPFTITNQGNSIPFHTVFQETVLCEGDLVTAWGQWGWDADLTLVNASRSPFIDPARVLTARAEVNRPTVIEKHT